MTKRATRLTWNRLMWGVEFQSDRPILIGTLWDQRFPRSVPPFEPTRTLLFTTRKAARDWCKSRNVIRRETLFRPVRVRETVRLARRKS